MLVLRFFKVLISFIFILLRQFEVDISTAEQQTEEANHSLREAIVSSNMKKIQETQSRIEMALGGKKRSTTKGAFESPLLNIPSIPFHDSLTITRIERTRHMNILD